jgi:hypothetical protein
VVFLEKNHQQFPTLPASVAPSFSVSKSLKTCLLQIMSSLHMVEKRRARGEDVVTFKDGTTARAGDLVLVSQPNAPNGVTMAKLGTRLNGQASEHLSRSPALYF